MGGLQLDAAAIDRALCQQPHRELIGVLEQAGIARRPDGPVVRPWRPERDRAPMETRDSMILPS